jgi:hypothetical protein
VAFRLPDRPDEHTIEARWRGFTQPANPPDAAAHSRHQKLQQEHRLITKAITAIEQAKPIRDQRGPLRVTVPRVTVSFRHGKKR